MLARKQSFQVIGEKHGTDKVTYHGYHRFYPRFIEPLRDLVGIGMLEIGIDQKKSLNTWLEYFPKAFIYGLDIGVSAEGERHKIFKADQSSLPSLEAISKEIAHPIFFVCDDGSHVPEHIFISFCHLFLHVLQAGGIYAIEDVETSYWRTGELYGYKVHKGYRNPGQVIEVFKHLADDVNSDYLLPQDKQKQSHLVHEIPDEVRSWVGSITFAQNCIIVTKKTVEEKALYDNRPYKWPSYLV